jgi:hypothetical protein
MLSRATSLPDGGVGVPKGTPADIVEPAVRARMADIGSEPLPESTAEFANLVARETEKWSKVVKFAGLVRRAKLAG